MLDAVEVMHPYGEATRWVRAPYRAEVYDWVSSDGGSTIDVDSRLWGGPNPLVQTQLEHTLSGMARVTYSRQSLVRNSAARRCVAWGN